MSKRQFKKIREDYRKTCKHLHKLYLSMGGNSFMDSDECTEILCRISDNVRAFAKLCGIPATVAADMLFPEGMN